MMHGAMSLKNVVMLCEEFKDKLKKMETLQTECLPSLSTPARVLHVVP